MTREQLRRTTQRRLKQSKLSLRRFAEAHQTNASHLCQFLKHGEPPKPSTLQALGYRRVERESYEAI